MSDPTGRQRYRRVAAIPVEVKKGDPSWIDFPPPCDNVLMTVFGMEVRIECDKGDELKVLNGIKEWINRDLLARAEPETKGVEAETVTPQKNFIG